MNGALPGNVTLSDAQAACIKANAGTLIGTVAASAAIRVGAGYFGYRSAKKVTSSMFLRFGGALAGWYLSGLVVGPVLVAPVFNRISSTCNLPYPVST